MPFRMQCASITSRWAAAPQPLPFPHSFPCHGCYSPVNYVPVLLQLDHHDMNLRSQAFVLPPINGDAQVKLRLFPVGARFVITSPDQLRGLTTSLLETVAAMHEAGLVHRDIRGDNIVHHSGQWILIDWELAGLVDARVWWSPKAKPPDIKLGGPWPIAADLWQIGHMIQSHSPLDPSCQFVAQGLVGGIYPTARDALAALSAG